MTSTVSSATTSWQGQITSSQYTFPIWVRDIHVRWHTRNSDSDFFFMSPNQRLSLLQGHLQRNTEPRAPEFPCLSPAERNSYFESRSAESVTMNNLLATVTPAIKSNQPPHKLVMIPGPVEFSDKVLEAMAQPPQAHTGPEFVGVFSEVLKKLRLLFGNNQKTHGGQPVVLSGSGTLGWDVLGANLLQPEEKVLCISTGFFSNSFAECMSNYVNDGNVTTLEAAVGASVPLHEIKKELELPNYKLITLTHTDTSTGVLTNIEQVAQLVRQVSPETLIAVDAVCSAGVEEIQVDNWGLDFVLTASQKAMSTPAGLSIMFLSQRYIDQSVAQKKKKPFYVLIHKWLPIMKNYENGIASYFATPSSQLVGALNTSLSEIFGVENAKDVKIDSKSKLPLELIKRFQTHQQVAKEFRQQVAHLESVCLSKADMCNGMTALYVPQGTQIASLLGKLSKDYNVNLAGGIHPQIAGRYIRIGHMGVSVTGNNAADVKVVATALQKELTGDELVAKS